MRLSLEKNLKIINEIVTYFKKLGNQKIHIDFDSDNDKSSFIISGNIPNITNENLLELDKKLNSPRQPEVEEYYWQLSGESQLDCELTLIGMMIDTAKVEYTDGILTVELTRNEK